MILAADSRDSFKDAHVAVIRAFAEDRGSGLQKDEGSHGFGQQALQGVVLLFWHLHGLSR